MTTEKKDRLRDLERLSDLNWKYYRLQCRKSRPEIVQGGE